jgi:hypothetical protein
MVNQAAGFEGARSNRRTTIQTDVGAGDWLKYSSVDFGAGGENQLLLHMYVHPQTPGQQSITVHLDSLDGPVVGQTPMSTTTDGVNVINYPTYTVGISNVTGMHDLYFAFTGNGALYNWQFRTNQAPAQPTTLRAQTINGDHVNLTWTDMSGDEDNMLVQRSSDRKTYQTIAALPPNATTYTDSSFPASGRYDYQIVSANAYGQSLPTNTAGGRYGGINPYVRNEAENADELGGSVSQGTQVVVGGNAWIRWYAMDFGANGAASLDVNLALPKYLNGGILDVHLDAPNGPLVGSLTTVATGTDELQKGKPYGWTTYVVESTTISGASGVHEVYLVNRLGTGLGVIDWIQFKPNTTSVVSAPLKAATSPMTQPTTTTSEDLLEIIKKSAKDRASEDLP